MRLHRSARSWRRCALAFASALAAATALVVTVPSGAAQASISQCKAHQFCMWQNVNYNNNQPGSFWYRTYGSYTNYAWHYVGDSFNDQASSVYNARSYKVGVNKDYPGSSTYKYCWGGQYQNANLTTLNWPNNGGGVNDSISAWWFSGTSSSCGPGF
jgi:hypothetical protein